MWRILQCVVVTKQEQTNKQTRTNKQSAKKKQKRIPPPLRAPRPNKHGVNERAFVFSFSQPREGEKAICCLFFFF